MKKFILGKFADWSDHISKEHISLNILGVCFNKYAISLSAATRLRNLEAKKTYIKKYELKTLKTLIDSMMLTIFAIIEGLPVILLLLPFPWKKNPQTL